MYTGIILSLFFPNLRGYFEFPRRSWGYTWFAQGLKRMRVFSIISRPMNLLVVDVATVHQSMRLLNVTRRNCQGQVNPNRPDSGIARPTVCPLLLSSFDFW